MSSPMPLFPGRMCCICFDAIDGATCFECAGCDAKWDMCQTCGPREGCINCETRNYREKTPHVR